MGVEMLIQNVRLALPSEHLPAGAAVGLAIQRGKVAALLPYAEAAALAGPRTRVLDGGGAYLLPGVVDPHFHLLGYAASLVGVDCRPSQARSIADIQQRLRSAARHTPPGQWLRAWGYSDFDLAEGRHPTAAELDAAAPLHPVRLLHRTGHACVLNSRGMALAGIGMETEEPPGGVIERDLETGEPNGVLFEMGAYLNARNVPPSLAPDQLRAAVALADRSLAALGVTAIHDATVGAGPADWDLLWSLRHEGVLGTR
ncbi:MAG: amidohydrolase family protein, partial [Chloroflexi bacterium]|nr:amidohydrolase family protein [Chloroflexota bacterium]